MKRSFVILAIATLLSFSSYAQVSQSTFVESNLDRNGKKESLNEVKDPQKNDASLPSPKNILVDILMNNKPVSLMFSEEENAKIEEAIDAFKNNKTYIPENSKDGELVDTKKEVKKLEDPEENAKSYIYLSSIIFISPNDWSIWIDGQKITSENNKYGSPLFVRKIEREKVKILWTLSVSKWKILSGKKSEELAPKVNDKNQVEVEFVLQPNQTFVLGSNKVIEGKKKIVNQSPQQQIQ